jgi:GMP synthase (glutamine-hydrolysing)
MIKPFLILQLRPEDEASNDEFAAFLRFGGLDEADVQRVRMERDGVPAVQLDDFSGVIVGGGPSNVSEDEAKKPPAQISYEASLHTLLDEIIRRDFPYFGACYGLGILAHHIGGVVSKEHYSESVQATTIMLTDAAKNDPLTENLPDSFRAFAGHKESCQDVPPGATLLASSENCPVHMIRYLQNIYAAQFHAELDVEGIILRINTYRHAGYFPPEDADMLINAARQEDVTIPGIIFKRFIARYSQPM